MLGKDKLRNLWERRGGHTETCRIGIWSREPCRSGREEERGQVFGSARDVGRTGRSRPVGFSKVVELQRFSNFRKGAEV